MDTFKSPGVGPNYNVA